LQNKLVMFRLNAPELFGHGPLYSMSLF